jgi:hypothetical protein
MSTVQLPIPQSVSVPLQELPVDVVVQLKSRAV